MHFATFMLLIQVYLVLIYLVDTLVRKIEEWGGGQFLGESDFRLSTGCPTPNLDSDPQNVHINFTYANLFVSKHPKP